MLDEHRRFGLFADMGEDRARVIWNAVALDGEDVIEGFGGRDTLDGGGGADRLFGGEGAEKLVMSSTKSSIGHLLGAAGAVEAIFCILALRDQICPPTLNLDNPSVETAIDLVPHTAKEGAGWQEAVEPPYPPPEDPILGISSRGGPKKCASLRATRPSAP